MTTIDPRTRRVTISFADYDDFVESLRRNKALAALVPELVEALEMMVDGSAGCFRMAKEALAKADPSRTPAPAVGPRPGRPLCPRG